MTYDRNKRDWDNSKKKAASINYDYDELTAAMKANGYTTFSIKSGQEKENIINAYTFNKISKNSASVGLDVLAALMDDMKIETLQIVRNGDTLSIKVPGNTTKGEN